jgi:hypothetical protein
MNDQRQETPAARFARRASMLCLALAAGGAWAQSVVLGHVEGSAAVSTQGDDEWIELEDRRNLRVGERLWTDPGARMELQAGQHLLRLDGQSHLGVDALKSGDTQISLRKGSLQVRVGPLGAMENFEVGTPNVAFRAKSPGRYRVDVDTQRGVTQVSVHEGVASLFGDNGVARELNAGQAMTFAGRALAPAAALRGQQADAFDRWVLARERPAAQSAMQAASAARPSRPAVAARTLPPAVAARPSPPAVADRPSPPAIARAPSTAPRPPTQALGSARSPDPAEEARQVDDDELQEQARQRQERREAQRRELARREASERQQRAMAERWRREHENWLRYNEGRPPDYPLYPSPSRGIPARRVG